MAATDAMITVQVESNVLSERQMARVAALRAARGVLVAQSLVGSAKAHPIDLITVATYIETGTASYVLEAAELAVEDAPGDP
jgi:hypothetical protein